MLGTATPHCYGEHVEHKHVYLIFFFPNLEGDVLESVHVDDRRREHLTCCGELFFEHHVGL